MHRIHLTQEVKRGLFKTQFLGLTDVVGLSWEPEIQGWQSLPGRFWCRWSANTLWVLLSRNLKVSTRLLWVLPLPQSCPPCLSLPFWYSVFLTLRHVARDSMEPYGPPRLCPCSFLHLEWPSLLSFCSKPTSPEASSHLPFLSFPSPKGSSSDVSPLYETFPNHRQVSLLHL